MTISRCLGKTSLMRLQHTATGLSRRDFAVDFILTAEGRAKDITALFRRMPPITRAARQPPASSRRIADTGRAL